MTIQEKNLAEKKKVEEAYLDGKPIQFRWLSGGIEWKDFHRAYPPLNWETCYYRVKPDEQTSTVEEVPLIDPRIAVKVSSHLMRLDEEEIIERELEYLKLKNKVVKSKNGKGEPMLIDGVFRSGYDLSCVLNNYYIFNYEKKLWEDWQTK